MKSEACTFTRAKHFKLMCYSIVLFACVGLMDSAKAADCASGTNWPAANQKYCPTDDGDGPCFACGNELGVWSCHYNTTLKQTELFLNGSQARPDSTIDSFPTTRSRAGTIVCSQLHQQQAEEK